MCGHARKTAGGGGRLWPMEEGRQGGGRAFIGEGSATRCWREWSAGQLHDGRSDRAASKESTGDSVASRAEALVWPGAARAPETPRRIPRIERPHRASAGSARWIRSRKTGRRRVGRVARSHDLLLLHVAARFRAPSSCIARRPCNRTTSLRLNGPGRRCPPCRCKSSAVAVAIRRDPTVVVRRRDATLWLSLF